MNLAELTVYDTDFEEKETFQRALNVFLRRYPPEYPPRKCSKVPLIRLSRFCNIATFGNISRQGNFPFRKRVQEICLLSSPTFLTV